MGLFSRREKEPSGDVDTAAGPTGSTESTIERPDAVELPEDHDGRPIASRLTDRERQRIAAALEALAGRGVDIDDLASISSAFDAAYRAARTSAGEAPDVVVELFGVAIGEHLARHSARGWSVVTDVFGTDLGIVAAKADSVIVPHNLVSVRWMRGETGWIPGVVGHLVSLAPRN